MKHVYHISNDLEDDHRRIKVLLDVVVRDDVVDVDAMACCKDATSVVFKYVQSPG